MCFRALGPGICQINAHVLLLLRPLLVRGFTSCELPLHTFVAFDRPHELWKVSWKVQASPIVRRKIKSTETSLESTEY